MAVFRMDHEIKSAKGDAQQPSSTKQTDLVIDADGDLTIRVNEYDPFGDEDEVVEVTNLKVNRHVLAAGSPVFKAMLTSDMFIESQAPVVNLYEDTGVSGRVMAAVFNSLHRNHKRSLWQLEKDVQRRSSGVVYKLTPLHLNELLVYIRIKREQSSPVAHDRDVDDADFDKPQVRPEELRQWLDNYSTETAEGIRTMKPFQLFKIPRDALRSVVRHWKILEAKLPDMDIKEATTYIETLLEQTLICIEDDSRDDESNKDGEDNEDSSQDTQACWINRLSLLFFMRLRYSEPGSEDDDNYDFSPHFDTYFDTDAPLDLSPERLVDQKPDLLTHFYLQFEHIQEAIDTLALRMRYRSYMYWEKYYTCPNSTGRYLKCRGYPHEHSEQLVHNNFDQYIWAFNITVEELPQILIALDKYAIPPIAMSEWFESWFELNFPDTIVRSSTLVENVLEKLMVLLVATYMFDHPAGFHEVTSRFRARFRSTGEKVGPFYPQLFEKFPGLKRLFTLDYRLFDCLNRLDPPRHKCKPLIYYRSYENENHEFDHDRYHNSEFCFDDKDEEGDDDEYYYADYDETCQDSNFRYKEYKDNGGLCIDCFNISLCPGGDYSPLFPPLSQPMAQVVKSWREKHLLRMCWKTELDTIVLDRDKYVQHGLGCRFHDCGAMFYRSWTRETEPPTELRDYIRTKAAHMYGCSIRNHRRPYHRPPTPQW